MEADPREDPRPSAASPAHVDFQLHTLGWKAFQDLCLVILRDQLGQAVQEYSVVRDGGRDGAFSGVWHPRGGLELSGETIVQCKFTARPSVSLTIAAFEGEISKIERLWTARERENYVLLTNHPITGTFEEEVRSRCAAFGCRHFHAFGKEWMTSAIQASANLRMLVPRLYGLGDLSQILDERWYQQTERLLQEEQENLKKFVPTKAYRKATTALDEHGFVLLLGDPAVGKTAIAATLSLAAGDAWKCRPMKLEHPRELRTHWNPSDPKQLFWIDDAFGMLQYDSGRTHHWNSSLPWLQTMLTAGAKLVLTSRNYIYARARSDLKHTAFPLLREAEVVVEVAELTKREREQILYNHIRLGGQSQTWRARFKLCFDQVAGHPRFVPEIARRLGTPAYTTHLDLPQDAARFVERPESFLRETIEGLSNDDKAALASIFLRGGSLQSPVTLLHAETALIARLGSSEQAVPSSLAALRDSFVRFSPITNAWEFKHPTIGDAFASFVAENPELVDLYISGVPVPRMVGEVTCGRDDVPGAKLSVPPSRYELLSARLNEYLAAGSLDGRWGRERIWSGFLASRCSKDFLELHIERTPRFWNETTSIGSYLSLATDFRLLSTLRRFGLLSAGRVEEIVGEVRRLAVETPDADFISVDSVRDFFTETEFESLMDAVREELIPNLANTIRDWEYNRPSSEEPDSYFEPLLDALSAFRGRIGSDAPLGMAIEKATERVHQIIADNTEPSPDDEDGSHYTSRQSEREETSGERAIYDDLDA